MLTKTVFSRNECYCGNSLTNNGATGAVVASSNCASACAGDSSQKCGGGYYMNVYSKAAVRFLSMVISFCILLTLSVRITQWTSQGCYIDTDPRILRGSFTDASGMTTEKCIGICSAAGYTIAGTEYGTQCLCGSTLYSSSTTGIATSASQCSKKCDGKLSSVKVVGQEPDQNSLQATLQRHAVRDGA